MGFCDKSLTHTVVINVFSDEGLPYIGPMIFQGPHSARPMHL